MMPFQRRCVYSLKSCKLTKPEQELVRRKPFCYYGTFSIILYAQHGVFPNITKIATANLKPTSMPIKYNFPVLYNSPIAIKWERFTFHTPSHLHLVPGYLGGLTWLQKRQAGPLAGCKNKYIK